MGGGKTFARVSYHSHWHRPGNHTATSLLIPKLIPLDSFHFKYPIKTVPGVGTTTQQ